MTKQDRIKQTRERILSRIDQTRNHRGAVVTADILDQELENFAMALERDPGTPMGLKLLEQYETLKLLFGAP